MAIPQIGMLDMDSYIKTTKWHDGADYGIVKSVLQVDQTTLPAAFRTELKLFLRVDHADEDVVIDRMFDAACDACEQHSQTIIRPTTFRWKFTEWTGSRVAQIDKSPARFLTVTDDDTTLDITAQCKANNSVEDNVWYLKVPDEVANWTVDFGCGYSDLDTNTNVWIINNPWALPDAWNFSRATLSTNALLKHAIFITTAEFYENRQMTTTNGQIAGIPSLAEMVMRPLRGFTGF